LIPKQTGGHRHAHICDYKVGYQTDGTVNALSLTYYAQGGGAYEGGFGCLSMTVGWSDSVYFTPNFRCEGYHHIVPTPTILSMLIANVQ
jgi:xanthine dehydrogenase molybdopterin-binding subunit B